MSELKVNLSVDRNSLSDTARKIQGAMSGGQGGGLGGALSGFGGAATKLSVIAAGINQALEIAQKMLNVMSKSSPYLKGILDLFGRSFLLFFKPFGDFLAYLLKPLAVALLQMAVGWIKWSREFGKSFGKLMAGDLTGFLKDFVVGSFDIGQALDQWLIKTIKFTTFDLGFNLGVWLDEIAKDFANQQFKLSEWLWGQATSVVSATTFNLSEWLWDTASNMVTGTFNVLEFIKSLITNDTPSGGTPNNTPTINNDITVNVEGGAGDVDYYGIFSDIMTGVFKNTPFGWLLG